jgi:putative colanic acid biosynthesis UDP-glucose lipid carrier transferase
MTNFVQFHTEARPREWPTADTPFAPSVPGAIPSAPVALSRTKRAIDFTVALVALLIFLPLLVLIAVAVRLETPGPALFRQQRTGLNGHAFTVLKFRTMTVVEDGAEIRQATRGDVRVTPLGAILRKLSLDEIPQILNVIRGEMSLIGPRPHALAHDRAWEQVAPNYARRFRTRPGLTGWAAIQGYRGEIADTQGLIGRVEADNEYIDSWSLWLDLQIIWRTIPLIFADANAY